MSRMSKEQKNRQMILMTAAAIILVTVSTCTFLFMELSDSPHLGIIAIIWICWGSVLTIVRLLNAEPDWFSPAIFFPTVYLLFFSIGLCFQVNWIVEEIPISQWIYYLGGLACFFVGIGVATLAVPASDSGDPTAFSHGRSTLRNQWKKNEFALLIRSYYLIGTIVTLFVVNRVGLPFLYNVSEKRFGDEHQVGGFLYLVQLFLQIALIMIALDSSRRRRTSWGQRVALVAGIVLLSLIGARTNPGIVLMCMLFSWNYLRKRLTLRTIAILGLILFLVFTAYGLLRVTHLPFFQFLLEERDFPPQFWYLAPGYFTVRAPIEAFRVILDLVPAEFEHGYGWFLTSPLITILPGKQLLADAFVTDVLMQNEYALVGGTALSFPVPFYLDFGTPGIVIGMIIAGFLLAWSYRVLLRRRTERAYLVYFITMSNFCLWIYGGFFPNITILWQLFLIFTADFLLRSNSFLSFLRQPILTEDDQG